MKKFSLLLAAAAVVAAAAPVHPASVYALLPLSVIPLTIHRLVQSSLPVSYAVFRPSHVVGSVAPVGAATPLTTHVPRTSS